MVLRFQLPREVLPLKVERARLYARITAPARQLTLAGRRDSGSAKLFTVENPIDPIQLDITREDVLQLDDRGGLYVHLSLSEQARSPDKGEFLWQIHSLEMEVVGETQAQSH